MSNHYTIRHNNLIPKNKKKLRLFKFTYCTKKKKVYCFVKNEISLFVFFIYSLILP